MAMPDYPTSLPQADTGTYTGTVDVGLITSPMPSARPNTNRVNNSPKTELSLSFTMDNDTYDAWITWVRDNAFDWFNLPIVAPNEPGILTTKRVRFISTGQYQKLGDDWLSVTVAAETVPGDF